MDDALFITGGAGFLGRAILARAANEGWLSNITIYSRDEHKQQQVKRRWPEVRCILGDVRDRDRLEAAISGHAVVIHAAALKYVPEAEFNVAEAIAVNLHGSEVVARAAVRAGANTVIGISTDKACRPVNVYGATKLLAERLFAEADQWSPTEFVSVRYGNVVGSTGSVIPLFQHQLQEKGRILLTDPNMTRFWLSIHEAVNLIFWGINEAQGGTVVIPRCPAMRMGDLAKSLAPEGSIEVIGARPGEKQHEELVQHEESGRIVSRGDYFELQAVGIPLKGDQWTYASHNPAHWVAVEEMQQMIVKAAEI